MIKRDFKEYRFTSFWREDDDDIIFWNYTPDTVMDIDTAKELVRNRLEYSKGKAVYSVIEISNLKSVSKEAREYMSQPESGLKGILAGAFISDRPVTTMVVNFFLTINKPAIPAKFFTNKDDALNWIKKLKVINDAS